jgi:hypothetical protein
LLLLIHNNFGLFLTRTLLFDLTFFLALLWLCWFWDLFFLFLVVLLDVLITLIINIFIYLFRNILKFSLLVLPLIFHSHAFNFISLFCRLGLNWSINSLQSFFNSSLFSSHNFIHLGIFLLDLLILFISFHNIILSLYFLELINKFIDSLVENTVLPNYLSLLLYLFNIVELFKLIYIF